MIESQSAQIIFAHFQLLFLGLSILNDMEQTSCAAVQIGLALDSFNVLDDYLQEEESQLIPFMTVRSIEKKERGVSKLFSEVSINATALHLFYKRRARHLITAIDLLNYEALQLPTEYADSLRMTLSTTQVALRPFIKKSLQASGYKKKFEFRLDSIAFFRVEVPYARELRLIKDGEYIFYNPLSIRFNLQGENKCFLFPEEEQHNIPYLRDFYGYKDKTENDNFTQSITNPEYVKSESPQGNYRKNNSKKKYSKRTKKAGKKTTKPTKKIIEKKEQPQQKREEEIKEEIRTPEVPEAPEVTISLSAPEITPQIPQVLTENVQEEEEEDEETRFETNLAFAHECLFQAMKDGKSLENAHIFQKAHSLKQTLTAHPELLEQIQEATSELSIFTLFEKSKKVSSSKTQQINTVPEHAVVYFERFMVPPLTFLKDKIDFGFVRVLIRMLGGEVDDTRAGSRIHLRLKDQNTSIHLHKKTNGILDSGRIFSLRQFIINAGFHVSN